jgi:hypothetical protein
LFISYLAAKDKIEIKSLYAGSGTVVHIAFPQNKNLLIDCGRVKDGEAAICPYLWGKGIRKIDMIIITSDDKRRSGGLKSITDNFPVSGIVYPCSITKQIKYFINSSTITLIPSSQGHLTACVDFAGKRTVCMDQDYIPTELEGSTVDVLHISCRRKENPDIIPFIGRIKPCAVILSGTVPKDMPENKNYYILRECGAVSVTINSNGMHIKKFLEGDTSTDEDSEQ